eukprot:1161664-Pelagomonas_calceolata.AAC.27
MVEAWHRRRRSMTASSCKPEPSSAPPPSPYPVLRSQVVGAGGEEVAEPWGLLEVEWMGSEGGLGDPEEVPARRSVWITPNSRGHLHVRECAQICDSEGGCAACKHS